MIIFLRFFLLFSLFFAPLVLSTAARADTPIVDSFSQIPIMHEGRIKPMDSFARATLKALSGKDAHATAWLVETLFNPVQAENIPVLRILNPDLLHLLNLEKRKNKFFSYKEVSSAINDHQDILRSIIQTPEDTWTPAQHDFISLQRNTVFLGDLLNSLSLFIPFSVQLPNDVPAALQPYSAQELNYLDTAKFSETLRNQVTQIVKNKGENLKKYTDSEQAVTYLSFTFSNLRNAGKRSAIFSIIPSDNHAWLSPWQLILNGSGTPKTKNLFDYWQQFTIAYRNGDHEDAQKLIDKIHNETVTLSGQHLRAHALTVENLYNKINPFFISIIFYSASILFLLFHYYHRQSWALHTVSLSLWSGLLFHLSGILARMYILERPPVSTLYESILFVGFVAVLYGCVAFIRRKDIFWLGLAAGAGVFLHLLGFSHDQDGDSLLMLSAVLNTNFWLATHVICIMLGYAFCVITSICAHYALIRPFAFKHIHGLALTALLFSAVGTVLGGIWADQSWGRFWGWDPKENGALLIVLWLIWLLHGRVSGQIKETFVIAGLAYLSVIVALSWFGVNLLSVGLHAYGFTDSAAWSLAGFITAETIFIGGLLYLNKNALKSCCKS